MIFRLKAKKTTLINFIDENVLNQIKKVAFVRILLFTRKSILLNIWEQPICNYVTRITPVSWFAIL